MVAFGTARKIAERQARTRTVPSTSAPASAHAVAAGDPAEARRSPAYVQKRLRRFWNIAALCPADHRGGAGRHPPGRFASTQAYTSFFRSLLASTKSGAQSASPIPRNNWGTSSICRGRFEWNKSTPDSLNRALDYFTQAVVHDPATRRPMWAWPTLTIYCANTR